MKKTLLLFLFFGCLVTSSFAAGGDLSIGNADVSLSPNPAVAGSAVKLYTTVHNNSNADLNGTIRFFDEFSGKQIGSDVPFAIIGKATHTLFTQDILAGYGNHTIAVTLIPFDKRGDVTSNNVAYKKIFVDNDQDKDGIGDSADSDIDGDGVKNSEDLYPKDPKEAFDTDKDGVPNNKDEDDDNDGYADIQDAFPTDASEWKDTDADGTGDSKDSDRDGDTIVNDEETLTNPDKADSDADGINDKEDLYPLDSKRQLDSDNDGISNFDDFDDDNDKIKDTEDAFPLDASEWEDSDKDGVGDNKDSDDDNDNWSDEKELNETKTNPKHADSDKDLILDPEDIFPVDPKESKDADKDGIGDNADADDDNDGVVDTEDVFPFDGKESKDADKDGIGDNADADDDNDGVVDTEDVFPVDPKELKDADKDGIGDNADVNDNNKAPYIELALPAILKQGEKLILSSEKFYDEDGVVMKIHWQDDQGRFADGKDFITVFHKPGPHTITIQATDDLGEMRERVFSLQVEANWTPYIAVISFILLLGILWGGRRFLFRK